MVIKVWISRYFSVPPIQRGRIPSGNWCSRFVSPCLTMTTNPRHTAWGILVCSATEYQSDTDFPWCPYHSGKFRGHNTYLFSHFFHRPFGPLLFFQSCFPNSTSSLSMSRSPPRGLSVRSLKEISRISGLSFHRNPPDPPGRRGKKAAENSAVLPKPPSKRDWKWKFLGTNGRFGTVWSSVCYFLDFKSYK